MTFKIELTDDEKRNLWAACDIPVILETKEYVGWYHDVCFWHAFAKELKQWILRLQNQNVSTCMFCGAESFPPNSKTKFLEHIAECPQHPLYQVRSTLEAWANLKGHDKCWHHPEVLQKLCEIVGVPTSNDPCLPSRSEFEQGCRKYQDDIYR